MYLIGLTGNIATGKSTVCQILQELGARVIDADLVAHAVLQRGTLAWRGVVEAFGYDILQYDGTVDRRKLGSVVFQDPAKLKTLERITHPAVGTELALMLREAKEEIAVVEAVKLYEAGLHQYMDALWVVTAPVAEQKRRLIQERGMREQDADARLRAQPPLDEKLQRAHAVIDNGGTIEETRVQVMRAFVSINPSRARDKSALLQHWLLDRPMPTTPLATVETTPAPAVVSSSAQEGWTVHRARPGDAAQLAELLGQIEGRTEPIPRAEMLERQGKVGYWLVQDGKAIIALAAWQAENLAAIVRELWVRDPADAARALPLLLEAIQKEAAALTCEVVVIIAPPRAAALAQELPPASGYVPTTVLKLHKLWRSVVEPLLQGDETLYARQLREIVTEPI